MMPCGYFAAVGGACSVCNPKVATGGNGGTVSGGAGGDGISDMWNKLEIREAFKVCQPIYKRDEIASLAMASIIQVLGVKRHAINQDKYYMSDPKDVAKLSVEFADALIEELKK